MSHHLTRSSTDQIEFQQITWYENCTLIWLDKYVNNWNDNDVQLTKSLFQKLTDKVLFFDNVGNCNDYIKKTPNNKIIFVVSGAYAYVSIPELHSLQQVHSILIYCMESHRYQPLKIQYSKIIGIFTDQNNLIENMQEIIDILEQESDVFTIYNKSQKSFRDLTKESASFLRFQLLKDVLLNLEDIQSDESKQEMLNTCKIYYRNNKTKKYLDDIEKFARLYVSDDVFRWYTKDSFIYKLLNKALRTEDPQAFHTFRFYINDLCNKLKTDYQKLKDISDEWNVEKLTLYRGLHLSKSEIERLKQNKGNLMSTNSFLSTTLNENSAKMFAGKRTKGDVEAVVYEITVNFTVNTIYFADIHAYSHIPIEQEYLFDLDASFKIGDVSYKEDEQITYVQLTVTNEGKEIAETYKNYYGIIADRGTSLNLLFGFLLIDQGEYQVAIKYYDKLMKKFKNKMTEQTMARIYQYIGMAQFHEKQYDKALVNLKQAYDITIYINDQSSTGILKQQIANSVIALAAVYYETNEYELSLYYYSQGMELYESILSPIHKVIGMILNNIGLVYCNTGYHQRALEYFFHAVQIRERTLPKAHPDIGDTYCNIGMAYAQMHMYDLALKNYKIAVKLHQQTLSSEHVFVLMDYHDIGNVYQNLNQYDIALEYFLKSLKIFEKQRPNDYMNIGRLMHSIGKSYRLKRDFFRAELYLTTARTIREKYMPKNHTTTSSTYFELASLYYDQHHYVMALHYATKALEILQIRYPSDHPDIKQDLELIEKLQIAIRK